MEDLKDFVSFFEENYPTLNWSLTLLLDSNTEDFINKNTKLISDKIKVIFVHSNKDRNWQRQVIPWDYIFLEE